MTTSSLLVSVEKFHFIERVTDSISRSGKMADLSLIKFIPANKKIEASALYDNLILHEEQLKTPNVSDGNTGMSLVTNKLECPFDMHDLEQFIEKKYCETRQSD